MPRSLARRSLLEASTYNSPSCSSSFTFRLSRTFSQGSGSSLFSNLLSLPLGCQPGSDRRLGGPHLRQDLLGRNPAVHDPDTARPAVLIFDLAKKLPQRVQSLVLPSMTS